MGYKGDIKNEEHYRDSKNGPVTSVVKTNNDGSKDVYSNSSGIFGSKTHSHTAYDSNGSQTYHRDEGVKGGKWNGYLMLALSELSLSQLATVEAQSTNEYVKSSARFYMQQAKCLQKEDEHCFRL